MRSSTGIFRNLMLTTREAGSRRLMALSKTLKTTGLILCQHAVEPIHISTKFLAMSMASLKLTVGRKLPGLITKLKRQLLTNSGATSSKLTLRESTLMLACSMDVSIWLLVQAHLLTSTLLPSLLRRMMMTILALLVVRLTNIVRTRYAYHMMLILMMKKFIALMPPIHAQMACGATSLLT